MLKVEEDNASFRFLFFFIYYLYSQFVQFGHLVEFFNSYINSYINM